MADVKAAEAIARLAASAGGRLDADAIALIDLIAGSPERYGAWIDKGTPESTRSPPGAHLWEETGTGRQRVQKSMPGSGHGSDKGGQGESAGTPATPGQNRPDAAGEAGGAARPGQPDAGGSNAEGGASPAGGAIGATLHGLEPDAVTPSHAASALKTLKAMPPEDVAAQLDALEVGRGGRGGSTPDVARLVGEWQADATRQSPDEGEGGEGAQAESPADAAPPQPAPAGEDAATATPPAADGTSGPPDGGEEAEPTGDDGATPDAQAPGGPEMAGTPGPAAAQTPKKKPTWRDAKGEIERLASGTEGGDTKAAMSEVYETLDSLGQDALSILNHKLQLPHPQTAKGADATPEDFKNQIEAHVAGRLGHQGDVPGAMSVLGEVQRVSQSHGHAGHDGAARNWRREVNRLAALDAHDLASEMRKAGWRVRGSQNTATQKRNILDAVREAQQSGAWPRARQQPAAQAETAGPPSDTAGPPSDTAGPPSDTAGPPPETPPAQAEAKKGLSPEAAQRSFRFATGKAERGDIEGAHQTVRNTLRHLEPSHLEALAGMLRREGHDVPEGGTYADKGDAIVRAYLARAAAKARPETPPEAEAAEGRGTNAGGRTPATGAPTQAETPAPAGSPASAGSPKQPEPETPPRAETPQTTQRPAKAVPSPLYQRAGSRHPEFLDHLNRAVRAGMTFERFMRGRNGVLTPENVARWEAVYAEAAGQAAAPPDRPVRSSQDTVTSRLRAMLAAGRTPAQAAEALGVAGTASEAAVSRALAALAAGETPNDFDTFGLARAANYRAVSAAHGPFVDAAEAAARGGRSFEQFLAGYKRPKDERTRELAREVYAEAESRHGLEGFSRAFPADAATPSRRSTTPPEGWRPEYMNVSSDTASKLAQQRAIEAGADAGRAAAVGEKVGRYVWDYSMLPGNVSKRALTAAQKQDGGDLSFQRMHEVIAALKTREAAHRDTHERLMAAGYGHAPPAAKAGPAPAEPPVGPPAEKTPRPAVTPLGLRGAETKRYISRGGVAPTEADDAAMWDALAARNSAHAAAIEKAVAGGVSFEEFVGSYRSATPLAVSRNRRLFAEAKRRLSEAKAEPPAPDAPPAGASPQAEAVAPPSPQETPPAPPAGAAPQAEAVAPPSPQETPPAPPAEDTPAPPVAAAGAGGGYPAETAGTSPAARLAGVPAETPPQAARKDDREESRDEGGKGNPQGEEDRKGRQAGEEAGQVTPPAPASPAGRAKEKAAITALEVTLERSTSVLMAAERGGDLGRVAAARQRVLEDRARLALASPAIAKIIGMEPDRARKILAAAVRQPGGEKPQAPATPAVPPGPPEPAPDAAASPPAERPEPPETPAATGPPRQPEPPAADEPPRPADRVKKPRRQRVANADDHDRAESRARADEIFHQKAEEEDANARVAARAEKMLEKYDPGLTRLSAAVEGGDQAYLPAFDLVARTLARENPGMLGDPEGNEPVERLFALLIAEKHRRQNLKAEGKRPTDRLYTRRQAEADAARQMEEDRARRQDALDEVTPTEEEVPF